LRLQKGAEERRALYAMSQHSSRKAKPPMTDFTAFPIFDGHNDVLLDLHLAERGEGRSFFTESAQGHLDLPRARRGGFGGGFFAIFPPAPPPGEPMKGRLVTTETGYEVLPYPALDPAYAQQ